MGVPAILCSFACYAVLCWVRLSCAMLCYTTCYIILSVGVWNNFRLEGPVSLRWQFLWHLQGCHGYLHCSAIFSASGSLKHQFSHSLILNEFNWYNSSCSKAITKCDLQTHSSDLK